MDDSPAGSDDAQLVGSEESEHDLVHESVELPEWVAVAFGLILVAIAAVAIWIG